MQIYIWQSVITPHMAPLSAAIAARGVKTTYVTERSLSDYRIQQGWTETAIPNVRMLWARDSTSASKIAHDAPFDSVHLCQGLRGNGVINAAQKELFVRRLPNFALVESIDDAGLVGQIKKAVYRVILGNLRNKLTGVLAIGESTPHWLAARGYPKERIHPFTYFISPPKPLSEPCLRVSSESSFRFIYVGSLIELKRVDLLIRALANVRSDGVSLSILGQGPLRPRLERLAANLLPGRVNWLGAQPAAIVRSEMEKADCLVLPSRYDGWGVVVSESLSVGTPVVCSSRCGASGVVRRSSVGGVFAADDIEALTFVLSEMAKRGALSGAARLRLCDWAKCLCAEAGATYLLELLNHALANAPRASPPWESSE